MAKKYIRLSDKKALQLGLELKPKEKDGNARYYVDEKLIVTLKTKSKTKTEDYQEKRTILSAWSTNGYMMNIDQYCDFYKLPRIDITSYKLVSHTGTPFYNIVFRENNLHDDFDYLGELEKQLKDIEPLFIFDLPKVKKEGVTTLTDLHFGAYVSAMLNTPEFNITILCEMLDKAADKINRFGYKKVHVHILGDLIESFTGLNHKNSWKGLGKGMFGVKAIKLFVKLLKEHFLDKIANLGSIKLVAGNHDRTSSDNNEDVDGEAAEMIAYALDLIGYDVEFSTSVITHVVDDICYILNHGHHPYTKKKTTKEMCWDYGVKGKFNFITEGHLHSRIKKLDAKQIKNFEMISDDNTDCRRQVCPSLFTGNSYSEYGGWSTTAGFIISEANDTKKCVDVFDFSL